LAEQVRCDVGAPTCAVAAVAVKVRARAGSSLLLINSSYIPERTIYRL
jgi:hypothetical protein